jgi:hypothetical protein
MLVPRGQIQGWAKEAEMQNSKVTDHDLLVAFIYKVSILPTLIDGCHGNSTVYRRLYTHLLPTILGL